MALPWQGAGAKRSFSARNHLIASVTWADSDSGDSMLETSSPCVTTLGRASSQGRGRLDESGFHSRGTALDFLCEQIHAMWIASAIPPDRDLL